MAESKKFLLRLDPLLFDALRRWADDELRSINAQIEYLLTDQVRRAGRLPKQATRRPPRDIDTDELAELEATTASRDARAPRASATSPGKTLGE